MKDFTRKVLALVERQADQAKKLIDAASSAIETFDLEGEIASIMEKKEVVLSKSRELMNEVNEFFKSVKSYMSDFVVSIPFDREKGEEVRMDVTDGMAVITVTFNSEDESYRRTKRETIPDGFDAENAELVIDETKGMASIVIPKLVSRQDEEEDGDATEGFTEEPTDEGDVYSEGSSESTADEGVERQEWADPASQEPAECEETRVLDAFEKVR